jgi:small subunit ribosomal protein S18
MAARKPIRKSRRDRDDARGKKKGCIYCRNKVAEVDYKASMTLSTFMSEKGKIRARRTTGLCRRHQNQASTAIKRAREVALLKYVGA